MTHFDLDTITLALQKCLRSKKHTMVAIDGPGGSGKSVLASELGSVLKANIVQGDDFYRVMDEFDRLSLGPEQGYRQYFDWERLRGEVLEPLTTGQVARYRRFDWAQGQLGSIVAVALGNLTIIEGVYSFRPELRGYYDCSIYVDTPSKERLQRLKDRGDSAMWIQRWTAAEDWYLAHELSKTDVDIVVSGAASSVVERVSD